MLGRITGRGLRRERGRAIVFVAAVLGTLASSTTVGGAVEPSMIGSAAPTAAIEPALDLVDAQRVTLVASGFPAGSFVAVAQCPSSATQIDACGNFSYPEDQVGADGRLTVSIVLDALLRAGEDTIDCRTDACILVAATDIWGAFASAVRVPLAFDPDAPLAPPPVLALQPDQALVDGQQVTLTGSGFVRDTGLVVVQCVTSPVDLEDCDESTQEFYEVELDGSFTGPFTVFATIGSPRSGLVDCRRTASCVLVGRSFSTPLDDAAATPLAFDPDAPLLPPPVATVAPDRDLIDGQVVTVEGEGFRPDQPVGVVQCAPGATSFDDCFFSFSGQEVTADAEGRFSTSLTLLATFPTGTGDVDCRTTPDPCVVVATQRGFTAPRAARVDVHFDPDAPLLPPPEITVSPTTDIEDGTSVEVAGTGFVANQFVSVQLCEAGGEAESFPCDWQGGAFTRSDELGAIHVEVVLYADFMTSSPDGEHVVDCRRPPGCEVVAFDQTRQRHARAPVSFAPAPPSRGRYLDPVFDEVDVTRDVVYRETTDHHGNPVELRLDIWQPAGDTLARRPVIMWMHGGYFIFGDKRDMDPYAREFARRGYVAISLQYRLRSDIPTSDAAGIVAAANDAYNDATVAVEWLKSHAGDYRIDPGNVAAGGYSAGAVTALNLSYYPGQRGPATSGIDAAVSIAGLTFGLPEPGEPPSIVFHGTADTTVDFGAGAAACLRAGQAGVHCELVPYEGSGHEIVSTRQRDIVRRTADFLKTWMLDAPDLPPPPPPPPPPSPSPSGAPTVLGGVLTPAAATDDERGTLAFTGYDPRPFAVSGLALVLLGCAAIALAAATNRARPALEATNRARPAPEATNRARPASM